MLAQRYNLMHTVLALKRPNRLEPSSLLTMLPHGHKALQEKTTALKKVSGNNEVFGMGVDYKDKAYLLN